MLWQEPFEAPFKKRRKSSIAYDAAQQCYGIDADLQCRKKLSRMGLKFESDRCSTVTFVS